MNEKTIKVLRDLTESFAGIKRREPISALIMDCVFQGDEEAIITFEGNVLMVESREDADNYIALSGMEVWEILAFALDNGLQLPQNEDDSEGNH